MKILIVEDEYLFFVELKKMLQEINLAFEILGNVTSIEKAIAWFRENHPPDLIFLDIQLEDGLCFEIFDKIKIKCPVIFTTSFDNYAIKAFELNSIDYLLKPVNKEKLAKSLIKHQELKNTAPGEEHYSNIFKAFEKLKEGSELYKTRFLIYKGDNLISIEAGEIAYFFSEDKVTFIVTKNNQKFITNSSLDELEEQVNPSVFFRVNRQFIISFYSIIKIGAYFNYRYKLEVKPAIDKDIIVSREKSQSFKKWLDR